MNDKAVTNYILDKESFFWTPDYLDISGWIEHIPFAFWIIESLNPKVVVELGVHNGISFFAFCQAVKRLNINTTCYGVDTWKGDEHAGFYEEEVFAKVMDYNTREYSRFSTLIRSTFDEAKDYFVDGSIDLLHIDGLHTYEAVKHDFGTWLPKLSANSIVVFHDINVRERKFGVFKLWEELKQQYRHFQFDFGHGLGILAIGEVAQEELRMLLNGNKGEYYIFLRNLFSDRGSSIKNKFDSSLVIIQQREKLEAQEKALLRLAEDHKILDSEINQLRKNNNELGLNIELLTQKYKTLELNNSQLKESCNRLIEGNQILKEGHNDIEVDGKEHQTSEAELLEKLDKISKEVLGQTDTIGDLKKVIQKQDQAINWYKDTYESRSILGVIKQKLKDRKKKIGHSKKEGLYSNIVALDYVKDPDQAFSFSKLVKGKLRKNKYRLNPVNNITLLPDSNEYTSIGEDPFFLVDFKKKHLNKGWYQLSIDITELKGLLLGPKLYYDYGRDFNEEDVWNLPNSANGKIESLINFPYNIVRLRFDPTTTECTFDIKEFHLRRVGKMKAFQTGMSKYKQLHCPHKSNLSFYAKLAASVLITGKAGLKKKFWDAITYKPGNSYDSYKMWCALYDTVSPTQYEKIRLLSANLSYQPLFSIIMPVYNASVYFLRKAIESVRSQAYQNWELCIADDKSTDEGVKKLLREYQLKDSRIKIVFRTTNGHISNASNSALELATGDFIVLLDQDDKLPVHCLHMVAAAINKNKDIGIIYSDEDKIDEKGNRFDPYFKTDWNKDLFYGHNMISHLGVYRLSLVKKIGGFRAGFEGSQDYDLALRCLEHLKPEQIYHIPHILYHWRAIKGSTAVTVSNKNYAIDAGLRALQDHFVRTGQRATPQKDINNSYRVKWTLPEKAPHVSIIIPTKDKVDILSTCISSILQKTSYTNFEVLIIDNGSEEALTLAYFEQVQREHKQIKVYPYKGEFNFSAINNYGVEQSKGDIVVLLNNDTSVINEDWLGEMVSLCLREEIGAVGAKLFYPNGQIQHAGVFLHEGHPGNHIYLKREGNDPGYFNKLNLVQNYSAVTAACLAIRKELYIRVEGLDEKNLKVAYNDVDFCLKVGRLGYKNVWTPFAKLIHYESLSRGNDLNEINLSRFKNEQSYMLRKWKDVILNDPFFNPNLAIETNTTQFSFPPKIEYEWQKATTNEHKK